MCGNRLTAVTISTRALEWDGDAAAVTNPTRKYVTLFVSCSIPYFGRLEEGAHLGWLTL